jgi:hypothetical protein
MCLIIVGIALPEGIKHLPHFLPGKKTLHEKRIS